MGCENSKFGNAPNYIYCDTEKCDTDESNVNFDVCNSITRNDWYDKFEGITGYGRNIYNSEPTIFEDITQTCSTGNYTHPSKIRIPKVVFDQGTYGNLYWDNPTDPITQYKCCNGEITDVNICQDTMPGCVDDGGRSLCENVIDYLTDDCTNSSPDNFEFCKMLCSDYQNENEDDCKSFIEQQCFANYSENKDMCDTYCDENPSTCETIKNDNCILWSNTPTPWCQEWCGGQTSPNTCAETTLDYCSRDNKMDSKFCQDWCDSDETACANRKNNYCQRFGTNVYPNPAFDPWCDDWCGESPENEIICEQHRVEKCAPPYPHIFDDVKEVCSDWWVNNPDKYQETLDNICSQNFYQDEVCDDWCIDNPIKCTAAVESTCSHYTNFDKKLCRDYCWDNGNDCYLAAYLKCIDDEFDIESEESEVSSFCVDWCKNNESLCDNDIGIYCDDKNVLDDEICRNICFNTDTCQEELKTYCISNFDTDQCKEWCVKHPEVCGDLIDTYCEDNLDKDVCLSWCKSNPTDCETILNAKCPVTELDSKIGCKEWCLENETECDTRKNTYCNLEVNKNKTYCKEYCNCVDKDCGYSARCESCGSCAGENGECNSIGKCVTGGGGEGDRKSVV